MRRDSRVQWTIVQLLRVGLVLVLCVLSTFVVTIRMNESVYLKDPLYTFNLTAPIEVARTCLLQSKLHTCYGHDAVVYSWFIWSEMIRLPYGIICFCGIVFVVSIFVSWRRASPHTQTRKGAEWLQMTSPSATFAVATPFALVAVYMRDYRPDDVNTWCGPGTDVCRRSMVPFYDPSPDLIEIYHATLNDTRRIYNSILAVYALIPLTAPILRNYRILRKRCQRNTHAYQEVVLEEDVELFGVVLDATLRPRKDESDLVDALAAYLPPELCRLILSLTLVDLNDEW